MLHAMSLRPLIACRGRPSPYTAAILTSTRSYAVQTPGKPSLKIFNRKAKHLQKDRAAQNVEQSRKVDYLKDEVAMRLCERLLVG
jgi:NADH dehydrogenase [ubiquinone] 1 alpha subcomplex assembly factor 5